MARQIKRFVDVEIRKDTPRVSAAGFGVLLILTNSATITTAQRVKRFLSLAGVNTVFDSTTEEGKAADAFFNQDPFLENQPEELLFGRYVDADSAAVLECGDSPETDYLVWKAITDGEFAITVDGTLRSLSGLDFSAVTSLDDVAAVISAALTGGTVTFLVNRFIFTSDTTGVASTITLLSTVAVPAGTDISGTGYLDGDTAYSLTETGGSRLSQGQAAETIEEAITAIEAANNDWYALGVVKALRDIDATEDITVAIESRRKMALIATNDPNVLVLGSTSDICSVTKALNYKRTAFIYHGNVSVYPDISWMGQQLPKPVGSTNWAFKELAGIADGAAVEIVASLLTEAQLDSALDKNCNVYTSTLSADFTYYGTMSGGKNIDKEGEYIDIIRNIDFLQARLEEGLMSLLLEKDIIYMTNAGIGIVEGRTLNLLHQYGADQGILIAESIVVSYPKRSEISQTDRDDRKLPGGTFTADLTGGINTITLRGVVSV